VAAAIAYPYYTTVKDITVCGDIAIKGGNYTAGVLAYTRLCLNASDLTVSGNAGSYITGAKTVGGVIADIQLNHGLVADYSNFSVSGVKITGDIRYEGTDIFSREVDVNNLRKAIGMVFQKPNPFPMSIYDNIAYGPRTHGITNKVQLDEIVESALRGAAIWDEVKDQTEEECPRYVRWSAAAFVHRKSAGCRAQSPFDG
jgi:energy-coupling factor transporter ATP-binding protein EcfA2